MKTNLYNSRRRNNALPCFVRSAEKVGLGVYKRCIKPRHVWRVVFLCVPVSLLALSCTASWILAATDPTPSVYYQNLVELFNRKSMNVQKPSGLLVENGNWQSERVIFRDTEYGTEIWKLTNDPDYSRHNNSVNRTPWNCDGSFISIMSARNVPGLPYEGWFHYFVMDAAGDSFRVLNLYGSSSTRAVLDNGQITTWDRLNPGLMYFGYYDGLYKVDVRNGDQMTLEEPLPNTSVRKEIISYPSENNVILVNDRNTGNSSYFPKIYMIDLRKARGAQGRLTSYDIHFNLTGITGHDVANEFRYHDMMFTRTPDDRWQINYEGPDQGERVTFEIPFDGKTDSISTAFTGYDAVLPYYSHPFWKYDGRYVAYFGESRFNANDWGLQIRDQRTQTPVALLTPLYTSTGGHVAWDGYDPNWVFAAPSEGSWGGTIIKARTDGTLAARFVNADVRVNGGANDYSSLPRPAQSPDGTKCFYASSMLQTVDTKTDAYVAVARRPYPPVNVRAQSLSRSQVTVTWDRPQIAREIRGFHVYRSVDSDNQFLEITTDLTTGQAYTDNSLASGHTYYYAVTSEEYSGLESEDFSNIMRVTVSSSSATWDNYRTEGLKAWDTTAPAQISGLSVSQLSAGVYQLTWTGPADKDVRYYNIYYSVAGAPATTQARLIASPGAKSSKFIDWQANPGFAPFYGVTAVDRAGNESLPRYFPSGDSDTISPAPIRDLR